MEHPPQKNCDTSGHRNIGCVIESAPKNKIPHTKANLSLPRPMSNLTWAVCDSSDAFDASDETYTQILPDTPPLPIRRGERLQ